MLFLSHEHLRQMMKRFSRRLYRAEAATADSLDMTQLDDMQDTLAIIEAQNRQILRSLQRSRKREVDMARNLDETLAAVEKNTTLEEGLYTLIDGLKQQVANAGLSAADQAKVDRIFDAAQAQNDRAAMVLAANTPAEGGGGTPTPTPLPSGGGSRANE